MSKLNYLLVILILSVVGYVVIGQLNQAARSSYHLLAIEVIKKIHLHIEKACDQLKRYPDSDREFETFVLDKLKHDLHSYPGKLAVENFTPGSAVSPASFRVRVGPPDKEVVVSLKYYGSDYRAQLSYKGKLERL